MKQKSLQATIAILFILILLLVPVYWMIPGRTVIIESLIEGRDLQSFPIFPLQNIETAVKRILQGLPSEAGDLAFDPFIDRSFQENLELAASDHFPFRITFIQVAKAVDRLMVRLGYLLLDDPAIPADTRSGQLVTRDASMIIYPPAVFDTNTRANVDARIENYKILMERNPGVNIFVFYHERLASSLFHPLNPYFPNADSGQAFQYFEQQKPEGLMLGKMMLTGMQDHLKYYYRSDHHWNIHGAWKAYEEIYQLIAPHYPQMSPRLKLNGFKTFPGVMLYGSLARKAFYPIAPDEFEVADVEMPLFKIYNRDGKQMRYNQMYLYQVGDYLTDAYINHYGNYFGIDRDVVEYVYENSATRNLLLIGSSFTTPVAPWIAAHYQHTYRIDLRRYTLVSLKKFIEQFDIDDVLVIGDITAIGDPEWMINP